MNDRSALAGVLASLVRLLTSVVSWTTSAVSATATRAWRLLVDPVRRAVTGPGREVVLGRRTEVSLPVVLLSPVLAPGAMWWGGSTIGYATLDRWVSTTWFGTDPSGTVLLAAALLVALGAASAAMNSGLLPTSVLVSAPIFGAVVTRYGTDITYSARSPVVSLPDAVGLAALIAVVFGVPIAVRGFLLGSAIRRVIPIGSGEPESSSRADTN